MTLSSTVIEETGLHLLITEFEIRLRVSQLARQIAEDYKNTDFVIVGVLKGAFVFVADLMRRISDLGAKPQIDFIRTSSYGKNDKSSGNVKIDCSMEMSIEGKAVLIVDDVVDSGRTLVELYRFMTEKGAASVRCAVLLEKPSARQVDIKPEYIGFEIPDRFVVGYGLDFAEQFRFLPFIATVESAEGS